MKDFDYMKAISETGSNFYGIEQLRWYFIEPNSPINNKHHYEWKRFDEVIRKIEKVNGRTLITIISASTWATRLKKKTRVASPPEESHWDDYKAFVTAVVERYDKDGYEDMPGLKYPHLYYQIEDEAENPSSWDGSADEYLKLLRTAYEGAKRANPRAKILTFSPNFGDTFDHLTPKECERKIEKYLSMRKGGGGRVARKLHFVKTVLEAEDAYDIVAIQYNYHYTGLYGIVNLVRRFSHKPIWAADAASSVLLGRHQRIKAEYTKKLFPNLTESEIAKILADKRHPRYLEIKDWWETEKSRTTFKKIVTAASLNVEHIFIQFIFDMRSVARKHDATAVNPWNFTGLLDNNGRARPVVYTIKLFHEKLGSFSTVEDLTKREGSLSEWVFHYRFKVRKKTLEVLWTEGGNKKYSLNKRCSRLLVNRIIEKKDDISSGAEYRESHDVTISRSPLIIECVRETQ